MKKTVFLLAALAAFMAPWGCSPSEPALPQWDVSLARIPVLGADTLLIGDELQEDNTYFDNDDLLHIAMDGTEQMDIADNMKQEPVNVAPYSGQIGDFEVSQNFGQSVEIGVFDLFPVLTSGNIVVPAGEIAEIERFYSMDNYLSATFASGTLTLTLRNNMPFGFGAPIEIELVDQNSSATVTNWTFESNIPSGGSEDKTLDLSGLTLSNNLKVVISGQEDGSGGTVNINASHGIEIELSMSNLTASSANAKVPSQSFSFTDMIDVNTDSLRVNSASISSGTIYFEIQNNFNFQVDLNLTLQEITYLSGAKVNTMGSIQANSTQNFMIDLSGTNMNLNGGDLTVEALASVWFDESQYTLVENTDNLTITASTSTIQFSSLNADMNMDVGFPSFQEELVDFDFDIPEIEFEDIVFTLVFSEVPADMDLTLNLVGTKSGESPAVANYQFALTGGVSNTVTINNTSVSVNAGGVITPGTGSGIANVLNMIPEFIDFSGSARVNDNSVVLTGEPVTMDYAVDFPFVFSLPAGSIIEGESEELDFDSDDRRRLKDNLKNAEFTVSIGNAIAVGGGLTVRTATAANQSAPFDQWAELISFNFNRADTDAEGNVTGIKEQEISLSLDEQKITQLADSDYIYWEIVIEEIPKARVKSTDKFILRAGYITGTMRVNEDLFDDDGSS